MVAVGQLAGGSSSAIDLAVGHTSYNFEVGSTTSGGQVNTIQLLLSRWITRICQ